MPRIGFLHTAEVHVATFDALLAALDANSTAASPVEGAHIVRPDLLARARTEGLTPQLLEELRAALLDVAAADVDIIVCTCSTISGPAERTISKSAPQVIRIDRPLATEAVRRAGSGSIAVVTAVDSASAPALELLGEEAARAGTNPTFIERFCPDAWPLFESNDIDGYLDNIALEIDAIGQDIDVIMIAQASMAPAGERVAQPDRVLSSPAMAVAAAMASLDPATS